MNVIPPLRLFSLKRGRGEEEEGEKILKTNKRVGRSKAEKALCEVKSRSVPVSPARSEKVSCHIRLGASPRPLFKILFLHPSPKKRRPGGTIFSIPSPTSIRVTSPSPFLRKDICWDTLFSLPKYFRGKKKKLFPRRRRVCQIDRHALERPFFPEKGYQEASF